jgi:hypothetical protein
VTSLVVTTLLIATSAADNSVADAKTHFKAADRLYREARYKEAISEFETAYRIRPHGVLFFNIGKCYEQLGDISNALRNYRRYLHDIPTAKDRALVSSAIANLEKRLASKGVQQLLVFAEPSGASVKVDDKPLGASPVSIDLVAGPHRVVVSHEGYQEATRDVVVPPDHSLEMEVVLSTAAAPTGVSVTSIEAMPPPPPPPAPLVTTSGPTAGNEVSQTVEGAPAYRTASYIAGGATLVGVGVGVGLGVLAESARNQMLSQVHNASDVQGLHDAIVTRSTGANIAYGAAAACGITAVALYLLSLKGGASRPSPVGTF